MKIAFFDVAEKRAPLVATNLQLDADLLLLILDRFGDAPAQIDIGGFEGEMKSWQRPVAVRVGITRRVEQLFRLLRIVGPTLNVIVVCPTERREQSAGGGAGVLEQVFDHRVAIDRQG